MNKQQLIKKISEKKEFSRLPGKDVEIAFNVFNKDKYLDSEKVKLSRDLLRKVYSGFASQKILSIKDKTPEWVLRKHLSTRERLPYYKDVYERVFNRISKSKEVSVIDLGCGINGFSYDYFRELGFNVNYIGIEAIGQLVDLQNYYFNKNKLKAKSYFISLFEINKAIDIIKKTSAKNTRVVFLFKTLDSLEMLKREYSKELLKKIIPLVNRVVISFATRSMLKRTKFRVDRSWIINFIKENFNVLDDFEIGYERYLIFENKK